MLHFLQTIDLQTVLCFIGEVLHQFYQRQIICFSQTSITLLNLQICNTFNVLKWIMIREWDLNGEIKTREWKCGKKKKETVGTKKMQLRWEWKKQVDLEIQGMSLQHPFPCGLLYSGFFRNALSNPGRAIYKSKPCFAHFLSHSSSLERHTCLQMASVQMEFGWHVQTCFVSQTEPQTSLAFSNYFV